MAEWWWCEVIIVSNQTACVRLLGFVEVVVGAVNVFRREGLI